MTKQVGDNRIIFRYILLMLLACSSITTYALDSVKSKNIVAIQKAWVRATTPGQDVGVAYMTLTSQQDVSLISVKSDVSDSIEIHNMSMENGVMKMRMLETLPLKAERPYQLAPGGFHLMLFDLKKALTLGQQVNFVLTFKGKNKTTFRQKVSAAVQTPPENNE